ncbi:MAG TPA: type II toxin-antitoxin system VapC family toxin [Solirubrobacterales bacterium]|nr:type II toxin-antitoxin system VapC family toxin [Solirubrobacterales bacterium]
MAIVLREEGAEALLDRVRQADQVCIGAPTLVEATVVLVGRFGLPGHTALASFLQVREVLTIPFESIHWYAAEEAFIRYGKGRHPAGLNLGDCMSYATARIAKQPLLFTGNDFAQTDIPPA